VQIYYIFPKQPIFYVLINVYFRIFVTFASNYEIYCSNSSPLRFNALSGQAAGSAWRQDSDPESEVYVATDDERIREAVADFGGQAVMTRSDHKSGTDRIQETVEKIATDADIVINVQGDEPFIQPAQVETLMHLFDAPETQIGTLGKRFESMEAVENPNSPKIVTDARGFALYFSRSVIPFVRGKESREWFGEYPFLNPLGIYAYRREVLAAVTRLPQSPLEKAESLEQLRWLENGYRIRVGLTDVETVGIDTPEDLQRAETFLMKTEP